VLQCVAVCCSVLQFVVKWSSLFIVAACCSVLQCAAVCCSVLCSCLVFSSLQRVAVCCSVLQFVVQLSGLFIDATLYKFRRGNNACIGWQRCHPIQEKASFQKHPARGLSHMRKVYSIIATYTRRGLVSKRALLHVRGVFSLLPPYTNEPSSSTLGGNDEKTPSHAPYTKEASA